MTASLVLVHGYHHGSWCWETIIKGLAEKGVAAVAVDLPGRGDNINRPRSKEETIAVINEAIDSVEGPVVLAGHSAGGVAISWVGDVSPRVKHLVYMAAMFPPEDEMMAQILANPSPGIEQHVSFKDGVAAPLNLESATYLMYHDCAPADARRAYEKLIPEPMDGLCSPDGGKIKPWERITTTFFICTDDRAMSVDDQRHLASRVHHRVEFETSHSPWLSRPELCIDALARIAEETR